MKLLLIAKSNLKKKKSNVFILFILVSIATMLLYTGISVISKMDGFLDEKNEEQNGAHFTIVTNPGYEAEVNKVIKNGAGFDYVESEDSMCYISAAIRNNSKENHTESTSLIVFDMEHDRSISNMKIIDQGTTKKENSIIMPAYYKVAKGYKTGDRIEIQCQNKKYSYEIYGFSEDVMFSSPSNTTVLKYFVSSERFRDLYENDTRGFQQRCYHVRLTDRENTKDYEDYVIKEMSNQITDTNFDYSIIVNYSVMRTGTGFFIQIIMTIVSLFAILIITIAMIVIRFSIVTTIENNMANIGILEALGYTSRQLSLATLLEFLMVSVSGIISGLLLSGISANLLTSIISSSIGMIWKMKVDVFSAWMSIFIIFGMIMLVTLITARKYGKITPLDALRNGINTHNFKKNHMPIAQSKIDIHSTLGIKEMLYNKKQNAAILVIVALLSFVCVLVTSLYYNFVIDTNALVKLVGQEKPNIIITYQPDIEMKDHVKRDQVFTEIKNIEEVGQAFAYTNDYSLTVSKGKNEVSVNASICNETEKLTVDSVIAGRRPRYENEIMVTNIILNSLQAKLGDVIYVQTNGEKKEFLIVGVSQQITSLGHGVLIKEDGIHRFNPEFEMNSLYVYLKDGIKTEQMVVKLNDMYADSPFKVDNFDEYYNVVLSSFSSSLSTICIVFVMITVVIISLIIFMLVKMKLLKDGKRLGIYKALGYTTGQLIWQITMSFAPVISVGALIGVILGKMFANQAFVTMLSASGIVNSNLTISISLMISIFVFITVVSFLVTILCSLKIRKVEPYKMIIE